MKKRISIIIQSFIAFLLSTGVIHPEQNILSLHHKIKLDESKEVISSIGYVRFDNDGKIYLLDWSNVRKYDEKGNFIATIIKKGEGPNELIWPSSFQVNTDSSNLIFYDAEKAKIIFFDLNGKPVNHIDPPKFGTTGFGTGSNGDNYIIVSGKKDECLIYRLDKDFKVENCFFTDPKRWKEPAPIMGNVVMATDSEGNIYASDILTYKIFAYDRTGKLIRTFAEPGPEYKPLKGDPPNRTIGNKFFTWMLSASLIAPIFLLDDNRLIVFYNEPGHKRDDQQYFFDIYTLEGKKTGHGSLERGMSPRGLDNHGRLVCAKPDISEDGTDVTNWLYVYTLMKGKK